MTASAICLRDDSRVLVTQAAYADLGIGLRKCRLDDSSNTLSINRHRDFAKLESFIAILTSDTCMEGLPVVGSIDTQIHELDNVHTGSVKHVRMSMKLMTEHPACTTDRQILTHHAARCGLHWRTTR